MKIRGMTLKDSWKSWSKNDRTLMITGLIVFPICFYTLCMALKCALITHEQSESLRYLLVGQGCTIGLATSFYLLRSHK